MQLEFTKSAQIIEIPKWMFDGSQLCQDMVEMGMEEGVIPVTDFDYKEYLFDIFKARTIDEITNFIEFNDFIAFEENIRVGLIWYIDFYFANGPDTKIPQLIHDRLINHDNLYYHQIYLI